MTKTLTREQLYQLAQEALAERIEQLKKNRLTQRRLRKEKKNESVR